MPEMEIIDNLEKSSFNEIEYKLIKLNKEDVFIIDDHINIDGHKKIAKSLEKILK